MIMGWHRSATSFLKKHRMTFSHTPQAIFALVMSLTSKGEMAVKGIPVCVDQSMTKIPRNPQPPTFRENYASLTRHASPKLDAAGVNKPVSVAFFGGRLDYTRLKPLARLFVNLVFWLTLAIMIRSLSDKRGLAIGIPLFLILGFILFVETAPWTANYMPWSLTNAELSRQWLYPLCSDNECRL